MVWGWTDEKLTREAQLEFCEADVGEAFGVRFEFRTLGNGNWLDADGGYICVMTMWTE